MKIIIPISITICILSFLVYAYLDEGKLRSQHHNENEKAIWQVYEGWKYCQKKFDENVYVSQQHIYKHQWDSASYYLWKADGFGEAASYLIAKADSLSLVKIKK